MSLEELSKRKRYLPEPIRILARILIKRYFRLFGWPLKGVLAGCRMRGRTLSDYRAGNYEPEVCQFIIQIVKPGWVCVDVGAHHGYLTLLLAKQVGESGRVIAFEAHPVNARLLRDNMRINGYKSRVQVENLAISDGVLKWVNLFPGRKYSPCEWNITGHDVEGRPRQPILRVPAVSLDDYFSPRSRMDFVKIDIEGAEEQALRGMRRLLRESRPMVLVEFHDETGWAGRKELLAADYRLYDLHDAKWLDEGDEQCLYHCLAVPKEQLPNIRL